MKKIALRTLLLPLLAAMVLMSISCTNEDLWGAGISAFAFVCWAFFAVIGIFLFVLWIITIVDCAKRKNSEFPDAGENTKTIWLVVLIVSWVIGFWWVAAIVYYFMVMKKMPRGKK